MPMLGKVLEQFEYNMTTPRLNVPGEPSDGDSDDDDDDNAGRSRFIKGAVVSN